MNKNRFQKVAAAVCIMLCFCACQKREEMIFTEQTGETESEVQQTEKETVAKEIYVDVCGAVRQSGVYRLEAGARVCDAIEAAGGYREDAAADSLNRALLLEDGQQVRVPTVEEVEAGLADGAFSGSETEDGLIDINHATADELMTLPGIGESKAADIIAYREEHGGFQNIEEIMQISGIKDAVFNKIKDKIKSG